MIIAPPLNGGEDFAGKSGRKTANACETNAMETSTIADVHFMLRGLIKMEPRGKQIVSRAVIRRNAMLAQVTS
jgi:hypothetical protein